MKVTNYHPANVTILAQGITIDSPLGGDLTGTITAPVVTALDGVAISGTPSAGEVLTATSSTTAAWSTAPTGTIPSGVAAGDALVWDGAAWTINHVPEVVGFKQSTTTATSLTLAAAPAAGHTLLLVADATTGQISAVTQTNVTWTQVKTYTSGGGSYYALWVGVVAASASASISWTKPGTYATVTVLELAESLTGTLGASASGNAGTMLAIAPAVGSLVVCAGGADTTTASSLATLGNLVALGTGLAATSLSVAYATTTRAIGVVSPAAGGAILAEIT